MADTDVNMKKKILDWIETIFKIFFWVIGALMIYWLLLKITGHSPTELQLIMGLQIATITILVKHIIDTNRAIGKFDCHKKECDRRFYALAKDFTNTDSEFRKHMMRYHKARYA